MNSNEEVKMSRELDERIGGGGERKEGQKL